MTGSSMMARTTTLTDRSLIRHLLAANSSAANETAVRHHEQASTGSRLRRIAGLPGRRHPRRRPVAGVAGRVSDRATVVTARARSLPDLMYSIEPGRVRK